MANTEPITGSHKGAPGGRLKASKIPVSKALPSRAVIFLFIINWVQASVRMAVTQAIRVNHNVRNPNMKIAHTSAGIKAAPTVYIILEMEIFL